MAAASAFQFGAQNQPTASTSTGFSFGTSTPNTGLGASFGGTITGTSGFSGIKPFGASTSSTTSTPFQLGSTPAAASGSGFSFGGTSAAKTPSVAFTGLASQSTSTPLLSALSQSAAKSTAAVGGGGFSFGAAKTTAASSGTTTLGAGLQAGSTLGSSGLAKGSGGFSFTGFGASAVAATTTAATTSTVGFVGLGGTGTSTSVTTTGAVGGGVGKQVDVKETALPDPLNEIAENIKKYVKEQKTHRDEISRMSISNLEKVREETAALRQTLALVSNSIQRDGCAVENLKMDTAQELKNSEIAQRTSDIPAALQHENIAPQEYFQRLVESFEARMQGYRKHIEVMENHLTSLSQGQTLTPQDLSEVMHKIHETFIALAAQLHSIHDAVKVQKEHYLNYRKAYFKDTSNIFDANQKDGKKSTAEMSLGPSPFSTLSTNMTATMNTSAGVGLQSSGLGATIGNPAGTLGTSRGFGSSLGTFGTQTNTGFGSLGSTTGGFGAGSGFGTTLGGQTGLGTGLGGPTFGQTAGTSTGLGFGGSTSTGLGGGLNPGVAATPAFGTPKPFSLQKPPPGNKRGKRR